ncbi:FUSC family protein [Polluticoccus soli]|uniref:FUSC family protein n=1 Tax=Polluticoccus soli TaxID=3034150 RepID=UPI0023E0D532|nr:FUSC family protein [Flavipsychrobacter sp. JY13-12]
MRLPNPYEQLHKLIEQETLEPTFSWGMRLAIATTVPLIFGLATGHIVEASWVSLTAEAICWVELRGSFSQGARVLFGGAVLAVLFAALGSITGNNVWIGTLAMLAVGFLSGLFRNLGDRGQGLSVTVFLMFIFTNAFPTASAHDLVTRLNLVCIGGAWNALVGLFILMFMPAREPYRRSIALIWKANAQLIVTVAKGWDGMSARSTIRKIYLKEQVVRAAIDQSLHFYGTTAHQAKADDRDYPLAQLRKATALVGTHIIAISDELDNVSRRDVPNEVRLKLYAVFNALQQTLDRMAVYVITLKPEEELLLSSRLTRLNKLIVLLREEPLEEDNAQNIAIRRAIQLTERAVRLIESSIGRLEEMGDDESVFRSYSLIKTLLVLHPKHWIRNLQLLFNLNTFTARYALRTGAGAAIGLFVAQWFEIERGYWIPLTAMIVMQPYFGATIKKGFQRILGTVTGSIAGGLLLRIPAGLYLKEVILFICLVLMVYYIRKRYSVAAFFVTVSLVLMFNFEASADDHLLVTRTLCTIAGSAVAIIAGFALLPHWDKKWLPLHLANAINSNYHYFLATFFSHDGNPNWTRNKRNAESKNSNAFDSFNRFMQEPTLHKKNYAIYYHLITHSVRLTRELNNINLEQESRKNPSEATETHTEALNQCLLWFNKNLLLAQKIDPNNKTRIKVPAPTFKYPYALTVHQMVYVEKMLIELKAMNQNLHELTDRQPQPAKLVPTS